MITAILVVLLYLIAVLLIEVHPVEDCVSAHQVISIALFYLILPSHISLALNNLVLSPQSWGNLFNRPSLLFFLLSFPFYMHRVFAHIIGPVSCDLIDKPLFVDFPCANVSFD
jgi:hypothetical protein